MIDGLPDIAKGGIAGTLCAVVLWLVFSLTTGVASAEAVQQLKTQHEMMLQLMEDQLRINRLMCGEIAKTEAVRLECQR